MDPLADPILRDLFEEEAGGELDALEAKLPRMREADVLAELRRHAHTLKGSAAVMNIAPVASLAAELENVLDALNEHGDERAEGALPALSAAVAALRYAVTGALAGIEVAADAGDAERSLHALAAGLAGPAPVAAFAPTPPAGGACPDCAALRLRVDALADAQLRILRALAHQAAADPALLSELNAIERSLPAAAPSTAGAALLVVEDSPTTRERHRALLAGAGYEVRTARDGSEALRLLDERPVDAVVSDVEMPGMDGVALTESIRRHPRLSAAGIMLVTSRDDEPTRARAMIAGADAYLVKQRTDPEQLIDEVAKLLGALA